MKGCVIILLSSSFLKLYPQDIITFKNGDTAKIHYDDNTGVVFASKGDERRAKRRARRVIVNDPDMWNHTFMNYWENPALAGEDRQIVQTTDFDNDHSG